MDVSRILADHGFGGSGPSAFFGDGSDGAFNPALNTASGTLTEYVGNTGYWANSLTLNPTATQTLAAVYNLISPLAPSTPIGPGIGTTPASSISLSSSTSWGTPFQVNGALVVSAIQFYVAATGGAGTFLIYDITAGSLLAQGTSISLSTTGWQTTSLGPVTLQAGHTYQVVFESTGGAGKLGAVSSPTATNYAYINIPQTTTYTFTAPAKDGGPVVKQFTSINIPSGLTVTVSQRCKGLILLCQGNVTINGQIIMDGLAPMISPPTTGGYTLAQKVQQLLYPLGNNSFVVIGPGGSGGSGGSGGPILYWSGTSTVGSVIANGGNGGTGASGGWWGGGNGGGGGGGAAFRPNSTIGTGGGGGNASFTSLGQGGSAAVAASTSAGNPLSANGSYAPSGGGGSGGAVGAGSTATSGAGGSSGGAGGGGGGGAASYSTAQTASSGGSTSSGGGGLILIIAKGNVTIGSSGVLSAQGTAGGAGGNASTDAGASSPEGSTGGGGGGGAGGGIVAILHHGTLNNSGTINVNGGAGGIGGNYSATDTDAGGSSVISTMNGFNGQAGFNGATQMVQI